MKLLYSRKIYYSTESKAVASNFDENSDKVKRFDFTTNIKAIAFDFR